MLPKDQDSGTRTGTNADVAPGLKSQSSTYPKFASTLLLFCVTHIDSCWLSKAIKNTSHTKDDKKKMRIGLFWH